MEGQSLPSVFVANKSDLTDQLTFGRAELESVASAYDSPSFVTSAKTGENVESAFQVLAEKLIDHMVANNKLFSQNGKSKHSEPITQSNYQFA
jgi:50S ribosomal subunit-associated GTPase HflX